MRINLKLSELLAHWANKAKGYMEDFVPTAEKLAILLERMRDDMVQKRTAYTEALTARNVLDDPDVEDTIDKGLLPVAVRKKEKLERQGEELAAQRRGEKTTKYTEAQLTDALVKCAAQVRATGKEIDGLSTQLRIRNETLEARKAKFEEARAAYQQLKLEGPTLIEQIRQVEEVNKAKKAALKDAGKPGVHADPAGVIRDLQATLRDMEAEESALARVDQEVADVEVDLDEMVGDPASAPETDELLAGWLKKN